jgi:hypothetical protein
MGSIGSACGKEPVPNLILMTVNVVVGWDANIY